MYVHLASVLPDSVEYAAADSKYDDQKLYDYSRNVLGIDLVCPITRYEHTPADRMELMHFLQIGDMVGNLQLEEHICGAAESVKYIIGSYY